MSTWANEIPNTDRMYRVCLLLAMLIAAAVLWRAPDREHLLNPAGDTPYELVTGEELGEDEGLAPGQSEKMAWDAHFNTRAYIYGRDPAKFLAQNIHLLPVGEALDMASSEGRNSVFLARRGFKVEGVDISDVALSKARRLAREKGVAGLATFSNADLTVYKIAPDKYDLILNMGYLNRELISLIHKGLKRGGHVVFQNRTVEQLKLAQGRTIRRDYLLEKGEARRLFSAKNGFEILVYEEVVEGENAFARLIARKL